MRPLRPLLAVLLVASALVGVPPAVAATVPTGFTDSQVAAVPSPTALAAMPDGRLLVASQRGLIRVIKNDTLLATPALDLSGAICTNSERGVLGVAADPDPASHTVYVFYTAKGSDATCPIADGTTPNTAGAPRNRVSRFTMTGDVIDPASEVRLLDGIYSTAGYHNAGDLHVGHDGYLYVTTGDGGCDYHGDATHVGGSGCGGDNDTSRDRNVLNGKVLRITTSGQIPTDNPFTGSGTARCNTAPAAAGTTCQEAYAVGLRNPFRFAFDPNAEGTSFRIDDVGQNVWEEIDQGSKGADYGWNTREGHCQRTDSETDCGTPTPAGLTDPIYDYPHSTTVGGTACGSITGGAYVPNGVWPAGYTGAYLFSDYVCGAIFALTPSGTRTALVSGLGASSAVAMAFAPDPGAGGSEAQSLYYTSYAGGGEVRKLAATGSANRAPVASVTASPVSGAVPLTVKLDGSGSTDADGDALSYTWSFGDGTADATTTTPSTSHTYSRAGRFTATLTVRDPSGASAQAMAVVHPGDTAPVVTITAPTAGQQFVVGESYTLTGTATDAQDGTLPASALSWTVLRHHETHTHPYLGPVSGNDIALVGPAPEDLDAATSSYLEIRLSATDSAGVTITVTRSFNPVKVPVAFASSPTGAKVTVNGAAVTAPTTVTSWQGYGLQVAVPFQNLGGLPYGFEWWSDHGAATHSYVTPASASTLTAYLAPAPSVPTAVTARQSAAGAATISWSPPTTPGKSAVTSYRVTRDGVDSAGVGASTTTVAATARSLTLTRLVPGRIYTLAVAAVNAQGAGVAAPVAVTVLGAGLATALTTVSVRPTDPGQASIAWSPPATGASAVTGYRVSRDGTDEKGVPPYTTVVSAATRTFTMTSLVPGRSYRLTVQAVTAAGVGAPVDADVVPSSFSTVSAPSSVSVRQPAAGQATLTWNVPIIGGGKTVTGYRVSRDGTDSAGVGAYTTVVPATARTFTMTSLAAGTAYTLTVQAVVSTGEATPVSRAAVWTTS